MGILGRREGELTLLMEIASKWPWKVSAAPADVADLWQHLSGMMVAQPPWSLLFIEAWGCVGHLLLLRNGPEDEIRHGW
jgi:hypothetical protein